MSDTKIDILHQNSRNSTDDMEREELLWEDREEKLLHKWKTEMISKSSSHLRKGKRYKKLHLIFGIPSTVIPLVMAGLTGYNEINKIAASSVLIISGVLTGVSNFSNFSKKSQIHLEFENRYSQLSLDIDSELCKPKKNRAACDMFIEKIKQQYHCLNQQAPM